MWWRRALTTTMTAGTGRRRGAWSTGRGGRKGRGERARPVRWLVATMGRRDHFIDHNRHRHPGLVLEPFRSTNGMNTSEARAAAAPKTRLRAARSSLTLRPKAHVQVHHFFAAHPALRLYKLFTWTYGMLASWTTKYRALEDQARPPHPPGSPRPHPAVLVAVSIACHWEIQSAV